MRPIPLKKVAMPRPSVGVEETGGRSRDAESWERYRSHPYLSQSDVKKRWLWDGGLWTGEQAKTRALSTGTLVDECLAEYVETGWDMSEAWLSELTPAEKLKATHAVASGRTWLDRLPKETLDVEEECYVTCEQLNDHQAPGLGPFQRWVTGLLEESNTQGIKCRMDMVMRWDKDRTAIYDWKTTGLLTKADVYHSVRRYGYDMQCLWYVLCLAVAERWSGTLPDYTLVFVPTCKQGACRPVELAMIMPSEERQEEMIRDWTLSMNERKEFEKATIFRWKCNI